MLSLVLVLLCTVVSISGEQVPCSTGDVCRSARSTYISSTNTKYCCEDESFVLIHSGGLPPEFAQDTECLCDRLYIEDDCVEGPLECENAWEVVPSGDTVKCCRGFGMLHATSQGTCVCRTWLARGL